MKVIHIDHIGIVVRDLVSAKKFFEDLGFNNVGETSVEGEWVGNVIGLKDVKSDIVMLQAPDGKVNIELCKFHNPVDPEGVKITASNVLGIRHICLQGEGLERIVASLKEKGMELVGEIHNYKDSWKTCYVRGPEEIIVELAERL